MMSSSIRSDGSSISSATKAITSSELMDKMKGCLIGFYAGDALAAPTHWYYDINQISRDYGKITKYTAPKLKLPGSIMALSNTGGGGRGGFQGSIVGDVILHGKKQYWGRGLDYHYHCNLQAGENTLDALVTNLLVKSMIREQKLDIKDFISNYVTFMTTPGTHNDTYAGTCHRMFFKNFIEKKPITECPDNDGHNVDAIDSLMIIPPIAIAYHDATPEQRKEAIRKAIQSTRKITELSYAYLFGEMLVSVLKGESIRDAAVRTGEMINMNVPRVAKSYSGDNNPMVACYIDSALPAMLVFMYKYGDDAENLLLQSTNAGGENVARGSLLGALVGASIGYDKFPSHFKNDLLHASSLQQEASDFATIFAK